MGWWGWLLGRRAQRRTPREPEVIRSEEGSVFVKVVHDDGRVTVMDELAYEYLCGQSSKPDPSQKALDAMLARTARLKVWAGGMVRDNPVGRELLADVGEQAAIEEFRRALRISEDPSTFDHCMCLGQPTIEILGGAGERIGTLGVQHAHAIRWDCWRHDAQLIDGSALASWLAARGVGPANMQ